MTRQTLGIIGVGAFGSLMQEHLAPYFDLVLHDARKNPVSSAKNVKIGDLAAAASCDVVVLAVPVQQMESVLRAIAPLVKPGALVMDVASVKLKPVELMQNLLPAHVDIVGTHPLFGPQSAKDGIKGLNMVVANVRGERAASVCSFLRDELGLNVFEATAEAHDRELAYVQGLTHLLAKVVVALDLPDFCFTTKTYEHMQKMVDMVRHDSDELFMAIEKENPFVGEAKKAFFTAAKALEDRLSQR
ncbi:MAG: prephenate dehydrogenase [Alphaproteobacteria bacterium]|nr:prephenate dehydrogenase [Alphaproteobacteria bacterium]